MPKRYNQACPVAKSLEVVGDRWTLLVVRDLLSGPRRFQDFLQTLPGIAPNILSARLKLMEEHGLIARDWMKPPPIASHPHQYGAVRGASMGSRQRRLRQAAVLPVQQVAAQELQALDRAVQQCANDRLGRLVTRQSVEVALYGGSGLFPIRARHLSRSFTT